MRVPVFSLVFFIAGVLIGVVAGSDDLAKTLGGVGAVLGYVLWVRARVRAVRAGKPFHLVSVLNIIVCTICTVGLGIAAVVHNLMPRAAGNLTAQIGMLVASVLVIWLHWAAAQEARQQRIPPSAPSDASLGASTVGDVYSRGVRAMAQPIVDAVRATYQQTPK